MKIPFKFKDVHHCEAVVLTCIDFRFWRETLEFVEKKLGIETFDFPSLPGAAKAINECLNEIKKLDLEFWEEIVPDKKDKI